MLKMMQYLMICWGFGASLFGGDIKEIILEKEGALARIASRGPIYYELALAYYKDQETDKAFEAFLKALQEVKGVKTSMSEEELGLYSRAIEEYVTGDPFLTAQGLLQKYEKAASKNRDYHHLNLVIAAAYANLGKYERFFELFYQTYPYTQDSFLADKIQATLYLKLSQRASTFDVKKRLQEKAYPLLSRAIDRYPQDGSLYKALIFLAKDEKNKEAILSLLSKMVLNQAKFARSEIFFYVNEAVLMEEYELAQAIIDRAQAMYHYSRAVMEAQNFLNEKLRG